MRVSKLVPYRLLLRRLANRAIRNFKKGIEETEVLYVMTDVDTQYIQMVLTRKINNDPELGASFSFSCYTNDWRTLIVLEKTATIRTIKI